MPLNEEYLRLNLYKNPNGFLTDLQTESSKWAYDLSYNIFSVGEVNDYDAINVSITNIILTNLGQLLFEPRVGSRVSASLFETISDASDGERILDDLITDIKINERRIDIDSSNAKLNIFLDKNSMEFEIPYTMKRSGLNSLYKKRISI